MLMIRTLPLPFVSMMLMSERSVCVSFTSRRGSPTLMPVPERGRGAPLKRTVWPSPAMVLPSAIVKFL